MKPEYFRASTQRPFTGEEYPKAGGWSRDHIYGEPVKDVTTHPAFLNAAASVAASTTRYTNRRCRTLCAGTPTPAAAAIPINSSAWRKVPTTCASNAMPSLSGHALAMAGWAVPQTTKLLSVAHWPEPGFYGQFEQNARNWYTRIQETGLYFNHAYR